MRTESPHSLPARFERKSGGVTVPLVHFPPTNTRSASLRDRQQVSSTRAPSPPTAHGAFTLTARAASPPSSSVVPPRVIYKSTTGIVSARRSFQPPIDC